MIVVLNSPAPPTRAVSLRASADAWRDEATQDDGALRLSMQAAGEAIAPSADDLRTINARHSGVELAADDVVIFQDYALHTQRLARRPLQFTRAALQTLAKRAREGRTVLFDHQADRPLGAVFAADVVDATVRDIETAWLRLRWYAVLNEDTSAERRQLIQDCRSGVLRYGSCAPLGGQWDFQEVEDPDGEWSYFWLIDTADDLNLTEYSRVYLGAAQGAGDHKFSGRGMSAPAPSPTRTTMASAYLRFSAADGSTQSVHLNTESDNFEPELHRALDLARDEATRPLQAQLTAATEAREAFRDMVIGEIVRVETFRHAALVEAGDAEGDFDAEDHTAFLATLPPAKLKLHYQRAASANVTVTQKTSGEGPEKSAQLGAGSGEDDAWKTVTTK
ncbi:MAG: hypothetical protein AAGG50_11155 [Bacteroidota bacterium]